jgi:hypothetical protein
MYPKKSSNQGTLSLTGTDIYVAPTNNRSTIQSIRFNSAVNYSITLRYYDASTAVTTSVYTIYLSAGDIVTDTFPFNLNSGDKIIALSNPAGATYSIQGIDEPNVGVQCK